MAAGTGCILKDCRLKVKAGLSLTKSALKSVPVLIQTPLAGLEPLESCYIQPLQLETLLSLTNRFLKFEFPPHRDYEVCLRLLSKALLTPSFSRVQLEALPLITLETFSQWILSVSTTDTVCETENTYDTLLAIIMALEELAQYNASALVSEDLALLEAHPLPAVHGELFRPVRDKNRLMQVLASQGYRTDWFDLLPDLDPYQLYWLCRRTTVILPWQAIIHKISNSASLEAYPYLARFKAIANLLEEIFSEKKIILNEALFLELEALIKEQFLLFSQAAHVVYPVKTLILLEGNTEALLMPAMAQTMGYNLEAEGIEIIAVGGKNQMLEQYVFYAERLNGPICVVMDNDAEPLLPDLAYYQRPQDRIFILEEGEFEDLYAMDWIVQTVNQHYHPDQEMTEAHFSGASGGRVETLQALWQELGLGDFNKVAFAEKLAETLTDEGMMSPAMKRLVTNIIEATQP